MPRPSILTITPADSGTAKVAALQTLGGAGNMVLTNGGPYDATSALDGGGVAYRPIARQLTLTSTGNISGVNFTFTGTDVTGAAQTEVLAGPNNNTVATTKYYRTITTIAANGAVGTNTSAGTNGLFQTGVVPVDFYTTSGFTCAVECTGTVTYTVQQCFGPVMDGTAPQFISVTNQTSVAVTSSSPVSTAAALTLGATGVRLTTASYTNGATLKMIIMPVALETY